MLKTFRRIFSHRPTVEFEISKPDVSVETEPPDKDENDHGAQHPEGEPAVVSSPELIEAVAEVRNDLERQLTAHEDLATSLGQIEPLGRQLAQKLDAICGTERHVAELVGTFQESAEKRADALQSAMETLNTTADRQVQVLGLLQEQIDRSQVSIQELTHGFEAVGSGLESLVGAQRQTTQRTGELVEAVRDQVKTISLQQRRLFGITVVVLTIAALALFVAIMLAGK